MHTINLTQIFLANQPWKNPHGENQSERRDLINFFSKIMDRNTTYLHHRFLHKIWKIHAQQIHQPYTSISVLINGSRTAINDSRTFPQILCSLIDRPYSNKCSCTFLEICAGVNASYSRKHTSKIVQK